MSITDSDTKRMFPSGERSVRACELPDISVDKKEAEDGVRVEVKGVEWS